MRELLDRVAHDEVAVGALGGVARDPRARVGVHAADGAEEGADLLRVGYDRVGWHAGRRGDHVLAQGRVGRRGQGLGGLPQARRDGWAGAGLVGRRVGVHGDAGVSCVGGRILDGGREGLEVLAGRHGRAGLVDEAWFGGD